MDQFRLHPSSRLVEAEWLASRLATFGSGVASVVPGGFPAYSRILHPARGRNDEKIRWADVAVKSGSTMHRLVQFHAITKPPVSASEVAVAPPEPGNLPPDLLRVLCAVLDKRTSTPDSCWFCLWDGYGWLHDSGVSTMESRLTGTFAPPPATLAGATHSACLSPVLRAAVSNAPRVSLPYRDYLLFEGPLEAATELGWMMPGGGFVPQSPNLFWPHDHAWCVASEIDLFCTLVAGSIALAEDLLADPYLEVWRVFATDPVSADSDQKNTSSGQAVRGSVGIAPRLES
jgi:hypothetical protein